jgi:hypothetical protein
MMERHDAEHPRDGNASGHDDLAAVPRAQSLDIGVDAAAHGEPPAVAEASIEPVVGGEQLPESAITLTGDAAVALTDAVAPVAKELARAGKTVARARDDAKNLYRLVPRKDLAEGLQSGALKMGVPRKGGDATVLVKSAKTGRTVGHADLVKAKHAKPVPSAMKALGPVAWQAMAMATQQHYLVEINEQLAGVQRGVDEILARLTDEQRGRIEELREEANRVRTKLLQGRSVDPDTLEGYLHKAGELQRTLTYTAERAALGYLAGERPAKEAEDEFHLALLAAHAMAELSSAYVSLPSSSVEELQLRVDGEFARLTPRRELLQSIGRTLNKAHLKWQMHATIYENEMQPKKRALRAFNEVSPKKIGGPKPRAGPLSPEGEGQVRQLLGISQPVPEALLIEVGDGEVRVAVESDRSPELPDGDAPLSEEQIDEAVTMYSDGKWWVHGKYGPYHTREAAVVRLQTLKKSGPS